MHSILHLVHGGWFCSLFHASCKVDSGSFVNICSMSQSKKLFSFFINIVPVFHITGRLPNYGLPVRTIIFTCIKMSTFLLTCQNLSFQGELPTWLINISPSTLPSRFKNSYCQEIVWLCWRGSSVSHCTVCTGRLQSRTSSRARVTAIFVCSM